MFLSSRTGSIHRQRSLFSTLHYKPAYCAYYLTLSSTHSFSSRSTSPVMALSVRHDRVPISRGNTPVPEEETMHFPRILCLHGGGVTGEVFRAQARSLIKHLPDFRLVFADGPFFCDPGPGIVPVYQDYGPFRRWLRWKPEHQEIDSETTIEEITYALETCKREDDGDGPWVGLLGFSQGAKLASSLLYNQQILIEKEGKANTDYKFAVLLAGRSPIVSLGEYSKGPATVNPGDVSEGFKFDGESPHILRLPTIHVHGLKDPGLHLHRKMLQQYHDPNTSTVLEWDGDHRVPIKKVDVDPIVKEIYRIAKQQGIHV